MKRERLKTVLLLALIVALFCLDSNKESFGKRRNPLKKIKKKISGGVENTVSNISGGAENTVSNISGGVENTVSNISGGVEKTATKISGGVKKTATKISGGVESFYEKYIRDPLIFVGVLCAVAFLITLYSWYGKSRSNRRHLVPPMRNPYREGRIAADVAVRHQGSQVFGKKNKSTRKR